MVWNAEWEVPTQEWIDEYFGCSQSDTGVWINPDYDMVYSDDYFEWIKFLVADMDEIV